MEDTTKNLNDSSEQHVQELRLENDNLYKQVQKLTKENSSLMLLVEESIDEEYLSLKEKNSKLLLVSESITASKSPTQGKQHSDLKSNMPQPKKKKQDQTENVGLTEVVHKALEDMEYRRSSQQIDQGLFPVPKASFSARLKKINKNDRNPNNNQLRKEKDATTTPLILQVIDRYQTKKSFEISYLAYAAGPPKADSTKKEPSAYAHTKTRSNKEDGDMARKSYNSWKKYVTQIRFFYNKMIDGMYENENDRSRVTYLVEDDISDMKENSEPRKNVIYGTLDRPGLLEAYMPMSEILVTKVQLRHSPKDITEYVKQKPPRGRHGM
ncbi:hypothetical protein HHI36_005024 [Cryptolaemus montrouzieri]|uniref:Uncharacterized protein n=1 Tax=Cryptolaemus montrouzieri TaxID=559131 RepID=A0ABD2NT81_9CUCU